MHFDCVIVALHYDCLIITLRLHFYFMTFEFHFVYTTIAMMKLKCNQNAMENIVTLELQFNCNCIFVALHWDCKNIKFRLNLYCITFGLHFDYTTFIIMMSLSCKQNAMTMCMNYTCIAVQDCDSITFRLHPNDAH